MPARQRPHPSTSGEDRDQYHKKPYAETARPPESDFARAPGDVCEHDAYYQQQQMQRDHHFWRDGPGASGREVFEYPIVERENSRAGQRQQEDHPPPAPSVGLALEAEMNGNPLRQARI